ncbi:MAG: response regulator [Acidobacteriota bacterium]|nr:response regulator [Acidobacteriota bacterium]
MKPGTKPGGTTERRRRRRALISVPVRIRGLYAGSNGPDETSTTVDVSRHGFLFVSAKCDYSQGTTVAVTFPYCESSVAIQAEQPGRVVRVSTLADGRFAIAIAFGAGRDDAAAELAPEKAVDSVAKPGDRPLIIVVDAEVEVRDSLKDLLTEQGCEVLAVSNSRQAHTLLNQLLPSLLIAEMEGYDLPGLDLCARIKSTPRLQDVPVVLTTRSAYPSDYAHAHSLGAVVCMAKPFRPERIAHVVRLLVRTSARRKGAAARPVDEGRDGNTDDAGDVGDAGDPSFRLTPRIFDL